jgi:CubicO group peptidase (beta-lactamase class C family)
MPILFTPGEKWNYSFSLDVVGRIMEVVSGKPLDKILHEEVFEPLNMKDTGFTLPADKADRMTHLYFKDHRKDSIRCIDRGRETTFLKPAEMLGGGGGLLSTLTDYYKFCHMLESNGTVNGSTLLSKQTLDIMRSNQLPGGATMKEKAACNFSESDMEGSGFGISWSIITDPTTEGNYSSRGTYSWGGLGNTYFFIDPIEKISVILMTQIVPYGIYPIRTELKEIVYKALK